MRGEQASRLSRRVSHPVPVPWQEPISRIHETRTDPMNFQGSGTRQDAGRDSRDGCSPRQLPLVSWEVLPGINGVRVKVIAWHHLKFPII